MQNYLLKTTGFMGKWDWGITQTLSVIHLKWKERNLMTTVLAKLLNTINMVNTINKYYNKYGTLSWKRPKVDL